VRPDTGLMHLFFVEDTIELNADVQDDVLTILEPWLAGLMVVVGRHADVQDFNLPVHLLLHQRLDALWNRPVAPLLIGHDGLHRQRHLAGRKCRCCRRHRPAMRSRVGDRS